MQYIQWNTRTDLCMRVSFITMYAALISLCLWNIIDCILYSESTCESIFNFLQKIQNLNPKLCELRSATFKWLGQFLKKKWSGCGKKRKYHFAKMESLIWALSSPMCTTHTHTPVFRVGFLTTCSTVVKSETPGQGQGPEGDDFPHWL